MKNKLYVLGDSFSALMLTNPNVDGPYEKFRKFKGGTLPKTWSELLAEALDMDLVNLAESGGSNYHIFDQFSKAAETISKGDYLFIGWTDTMRFRLYSEKTKNFQKANVLTDRVLFPNISQNTIHELIENRSNDYWTIEIYNFEKIIRRMSKVIGFKYYSWSFFIQYPQYHIMTTLLNAGATRISEETNGEVDDWHMGEVGHRIQFEYFLNKIKNPKII